MNDLVVSDQNHQEQLKLIQKEFFRYIGENISSIDASLSVFFQHVSKTVTSTYPHIPDDEYDQFLELIACEIFRISSHNDEPAYNEMLGKCLIQMKRRGGRGALDLVSGLHRIKKGNFYNAIELLKKYHYRDPVIVFAIACCYLKIDLEYPQILPGDEPVLSIPDTTIRIGESNRSRKHRQDPRPSEMVLNAREQLMELSLQEPDIASYPALNDEEMQLLDSIFWKMYRQARTWFPDERWFVAIALSKAGKEGDRDRYTAILKEGIEHFPEDIGFLRAAFSYAVAKGSATSAARILQKMVKVNPDDMEPIYYGLKFALIIKKKPIFYRFKKMAIIRGFPEHLLLMLDYAFDMVYMNSVGAGEKRKRFCTQYPRLGYMMKLLAELEDDAFSPDPLRQRKSHETLIQIIDRFALNELRINEE